MSTREAELGFIGLGNLGSSMALTLLQAGRPVLAYDTEPERVHELERLGASRAGSLGAFSRCQTTFLAVPDDAAVESVVNQLLDVLAQPSVIVIHSTILPDTPRRLHARCAAHGHDLLDAPVSGGAERARKGELAMMVGGRTETLASIRPHLELLASEIWHMGGAGAGAAAKLANQLMMFAALAGAQEAKELTDAFGVDWEKVRSMAKASTSASWVAEHWGFFESLASEYDTYGTPLQLRPWSKDLFDVLVVARECKLVLPVAALLSQVTAGRVEQAARAWRAERCAEGVGA